MLSEDKSVLKRGILYEERRKKLKIKHKIGQAIKI